MTWFIAWKIYHINRIITLSIIRLSGRLCICTCNTASGCLSESASHVVGRGFVSQPGHTKDHYKNSTNCLPAWHTGFGVGMWQCNLTV